MVVTITWLWQQNMTENDIDSIDPKEEQAVGSNAINEEPTREEGGGGVYCLAFSLECFCIGTEARPAVRPANLPPPPPPMFPPQPPVGLESAPWRVSSSSSSTWTAVKKEDDKVNRPHPPNYPPPHKQEVVEVEVPPRKVPPRKKEVVEVQVESPSAELHRTLNQQWKGLKDPVMWLGLNWLALSTNFHYIVSFFVGLVKWKLVY